MWSLPGFREPLDFTVPLSVQIIQEKKREEDNLPKVKNDLRENFPGGTVGRRLPARDKSTPGPGRFHVLRSNSACQPRLLKTERLQPLLTTREATARRCSCTTVKNSPHAPQPEKAHSSEDAVHPKEKEKNKELKEAAGEW